MRIGFDVRHLQSPVLRGMDRYTCSLIRELYRMGHKLIFFHRAREAIFSAHLENLGEIVGLTDLCGLDWEQRVLPSALLKYGVSIYHAPAERGVPRIALCPRVYSLHSVTTHSYAALAQEGKLPGQAADYLGYEPAPTSFWAHYWCRQARWADHILTPSGFSKAEIVRFLGVAASQITVTPLAPDPEFVAAKFGEKQRFPSVGISEPYLLYVGGYERHKNVEGLLRVFSLVKAAWKEIVLVAVGSGNVNQELLNLSARLGLVAGRDVHFLSGLTSELPQLYECACAFVSLSWRESFGLPYVEAMSRGTPVIASSWGAAPEVVGEAGELVDPRDEAAACAAILTFRSLEKRTRLSLLARERALRFSWKMTARATVQVYEKLLA